MKTPFKIRVKKGGNKVYKAKYSRLNKRWYLQKMTTLKSFFGLLQYRTWVTQRDPWLNVMYFENKAAVEAFIDYKEALDG